MKYEMINKSVFLRLKFNLSNYDRLRITEENIGMSRCTGV